MASQQSPWMQYHGWFQPQEWGWGVRFLGPDGHTALCPSPFMASQGNGSRHALEFTNLIYEVEVKKKIDGVKTTVKRALINDVSGSAHVGEVTAVMGPSGAGKTTFMDSLAGRIKTTSLKGDILFAGKKMKPDIFKRISAYVLQEDTLFPTLTVYETLLFSASVRLPPSVSYIEKRLRVTQLIEQLGLERCADTIIGNSEKRGVSGGERRRVSIGVEIIHEPRVVFLDEPTSGLDSSSAFYVMEKLKRVAAAGTLVMCTLHQPSFRILELIDRLVVLCRGEITYIGSPDRLPRYLMDAGVSVPPNANCAEVIMDVIEERGASAGGVNEAARALITLGKEREQWNMLAESDMMGGFGKGSFSSNSGLMTPRGSGMTNSNSGMMTPGKVDDTQNLLPYKALLRYKYRNNPLTELYWLMWRALTNITREPPLFYVRVVVVLVTGSLLGSVYIKPNEGLQGVKNIMGFVVFAICLVFFTSNDALPNFILERRIFVREASHYAYRASTYVIANMVVFIPFMSILAMLFSLVIWWTVGLPNGAGGFWFFFFVMFLAFYLANSFVTFLSALVPDLVLGNTVSLACTAYMLLLSGFFLQRTKIPKYWLWFHYLSNLKYPYEALILEFFGQDNGTRCFQKAPGRLEPDLTFQGNITAPVPNCLLTGADVLTSLGIGNITKWDCCAILIALGVFYRILFWMVLLVTATAKRK